MLVLLLLFMLAGGAMEMLGIGLIFPVLKVVLEPGEAGLLMLPLGLSIFFCSMMRSNQDHLYF